MNINSHKKMMKERIIVFSPDILTNERSCGIWIGIYD